MPTFREDLHLGHKVPTVETDDIVNGAITEEKMADNSVSERVLQGKSVTEPKLDDNAVSTRTIQDKAVTTPKILNRNVTPEKLSPDVQSKLVLPITDQLDKKFTDKTNELYSMIRSLQVGGIALSEKFGNRNDIGITQKTLTKAIGWIWDKIGELEGETYMDFTLTALPVQQISEQEITFSITADCTGSISDFDSIKIYIDNQLVAESEDVEVFTTAQTINPESTIRAVGVILGRTITKETTGIGGTPFYLGSGAVYTDVINEDCHKDLEGTLEGNYEVTISNTGDYLFIIIPLYKSSEFRRADMNGYEIPFDTPVVMTDYVVYKSLNVYEAGTYNVDIDINS